MHSCISRRTTRRSTSRARRAKKTFAWGTPRLKNSGAFLAWTHKISPRSTDWARCCSRWPVRPSIRISFRSRSRTHQKHIYLHPDDPEPYYWIGVIDWTLAFRANGLLRAKNNLSVRGKQLSDDAPLPPDLRDEYVRGYGVTIDEGIESLKHAISIKPDYDDAMAYLNLLYRRKADTVASESAREQ